MEHAFISIGSNINPEENIRKALRLLSGRVVVSAISNIYKTEPVGRAGQDHFYNCVIDVLTDRKPEDLKNILKEIEDSLGRKREADKNADRTIDLDIILYGNLVSEDMKIPDPEITERPFLAIPLAELAPGIILPGKNISIDDVIEKMSVNGMTLLEAYTHELRGEILGKRADEKIRKAR